MTDEDRTEIINDIKEKYFSYLGNAKRKSAVVKKNKSEKRRRKSVCAFLPNKKNNADKKKKNAVNKKPWKRLLARKP